MTDTELLAFDPLIAKTFAQLVDSEAFKETYQRMQRSAVISRSEDDPEERIFVFDDGSALSDIAFETSKSEDQ